MVFVIFLVALVICVVLDASVVWALALGLCIFSVKACHLGHKPAAVFKMAVNGALKCKNIIEMFVFIGILTGIWRICGTIPWIVSASAGLISPKYFLLSAFLLSALMSVLTGTSFGTVSTMGTVLMIVAAAGGTDPLMTAGAVLSGAYVGDRASPMSSCARLMSDCAGNDYYDNIGVWVKTALVPLGASCVCYLLLGGSGTVSGGETVTLLKEAYVMHWSLVLPAVLILVLSVFKVPVKLNMGISAALGFVLGILVQRVPVGELFKAAVLGYHIGDGGALAAMMDGGGIVSMVRAGFIVFFSSAYVGIFEGTGMLSWAEKATSKASCKIGAYPTTLLFGTVLCAVSCNQSLALMMTDQLCHKNYADPVDFAADMANSACLVAGLIPWSIACAIPLGIMGVGTGSLVFAFYLWISPIYHFIWRRFVPIKKTFEKSDLHNL